MGFFIPYAKLGALVGILFLTLLACALPALALRCMGKNAVRPRASFYYLMLFSCILIAATGINHVLPNAVDAFEAYRSGWGYPLPGIILTFMLALSFVLDVVMDRRKQTVAVAGTMGIFDDEEDLPPADPYLFSGAIYIHSVLEGLVLGAAPIDTTTNVPSYLYVILAVLALHKCAEGFSLAIIYEAYEYERWSQLLLLGTYALLTPAGVLVGMILMLAFSGVASLIAGICCAVSAGIFVYAGISIMTTRVVPNYARTNWRFLFIFAGWGLSSAIAWFA
jgi:zinc transporter ZupT